MKLFHFALAFMLLLTACSKDDEKTQSFTSYEFTWSRNSGMYGVTINSTDAYVKGGKGYYAYEYQTWLDYGEIGSLQDTDIYNIPIMSKVDYNSIPIREKHCYIEKYWCTFGVDAGTMDYTAYYITEIHRDKDGNILYIKGKQRDFVPYEFWL